METQQPRPMSSIIFLAVLFVSDGFIAGTLSHFQPLAWYLAWFFLISGVTTFGYLSKKPILSFFVGALPLFLVMAFRLLFVADSLPQLIADSVVFIPVALLLGGSGFFYARAFLGNKYLNLGIGILFILIAAVYFFFFYLW